MLSEFLEDLLYFYIFVMLCNGCCPPSLVVPPQWKCTCGCGRSRGWQELAGGTEQVLTLGDARAVGEEQGCPCLLHIHLLGDVLCCACRQGICVSQFILDLIYLLKAAGV